MKRLVAFLLVCVMVFSATMAWAADDNEIITFEPTLILEIADSEGYTKPSDWTKNADTRAVFSVLLYLDYLSSIDDQTSSMEADWDKPTFVFWSDDNLIGFSFCNKEGNYRVLMHLIDSKQAAYNPAMDYSMTPSDAKEVLEMMGCTVRENDMDAMVKVINAIADAL